MSDLTPQELALVRIIAGILHETEEESFTWSRCEAIAQQVIIATAPVIDTIVEQAAAEVTRMISAMYADWLREGRLPDGWERVTEGRWAGVPARIQRRGPILLGPVVEEEGQ